MNEFEGAKSWALYFYVKSTDSLTTLRPQILDSFHPAMPDSVYPSGLRAGYACRLIEFSGKLNNYRYDEVLLTDMSDATGCEFDAFMDGLFSKPQYVPLEQLLNIYKEKILIETGCRCRKLIIYNPPERKEMVERFKQRLK